MIKRLEIKNFRGIREGSIDFAPLTILLGPNNSGKTTILEVLLLAPNPFRKVPYLLSPPYDKNTAIDLILFLHETLSSISPISLFHNYVSDEIDLTFIENGNTYKLQFVKDGVHIFVMTNKPVTNANTSIIKGKPIRWFGSISISPYSFGRILALECFIGDTLLITSTLVKKAYQYIKNNWTFIVNTGISSKVAEEVSSLVHEKYINIAIEPFIRNELSINALLEDGRRIRLGDLGEGTQIYVISKILMEHGKYDILLWDNVESHFNPRILLSISDWVSNLVERGKQVIVTTHSLEAAKLIAEINEDKASILLTSLENNELKTKRLTLKDIEKLLEAGIDVRMAESMLL
ncbi:MAG: AAA family ATPase [Candidatus Asgardarchaeia archaeon]